MRIRTIHRVVGVNPDLHPTPLEFAPTGVTGFFEREVSNQVGDFLLSISRPGEYTRVDVLPDAVQASEKGPEKAEVDKVSEPGKAAGKAEKPSEHEPGKAAGKGR